jgi:hypothetical protein
MPAILYTIAMWVLLQMLFVSFCARLAAVKKLDTKEYLELQGYLMRARLETDEDDARVGPVRGGPSPRRVPPAEVARA